MNPVITIKKQTQLLIYKLTSKDKKRLKEVFIKRGMGHAWRDGHDSMCIMQAVSMVTSEAGKEGSSYTDNPLCVSRALRRSMISLNDSLITGEQRNSLKKLIPVLLNTRPLKARKLKSGGIRETPTTSPEYQKAEKERYKMLKSSQAHRSFTDEEFKDVIKVIKKAANLYHAPEEGEDLEVTTV